MQLAPSCDSVINNSETERFSITDRYDVLLFVYLCTVMFFFTFRISFIYIDYFTLYIKLFYL